jgi:EAL domain-containing protein (putative c-di-GMP-specific phosphodiesterase class I)
MTTIPLADNVSTWFLVGRLADSEPVRRLSIPTMPLRIGRRPEHGLCLSCPSVSKEHAEIFRKDGTLWIRDLQSMNGTYVNGGAIRGDTLLHDGDLIQIATVVFRLCRCQPDATGGTQLEDSHDRALAMIQFDRLISQDEVVPYLQPIVHVEDRAVCGFEVLGRCRLFGLMNPLAMFSAASQLNMEAELSRACRRRGVQESRWLPPELRLFVNTHPVELAEEGLVDSLADIRRLDEHRPMTLEIHEYAVTDLRQFQCLRKELNELNIQLAYDDFGAGRDRLAELIEVRPDVLKFDMALVRGIDQGPPERQQFLESLVHMVLELGIVPLAEGIERQGEHDTCRQLGFALAQGYFYGRPARASRYALTEKPAAG